MLKVPALPPAFQHQATISLPDKFTGLAPLAAELPRENPFTSKDVKSPVAPFPDPISLHD